VPAFPRPCPNAWPALNLTSSAARRLFAQAPVARLATVTEAGRPHVVPVTFAVHGNYIYTAIDAKPKSEAAGRGLQRLRNIRADPRVAVLADHYSADWAALWWVRADGSAAILAEPDAAAGPLAMLAARYPQYREVALVGPVIAVAVQRWTGWAAGPGRLPG
jgi:PPOX class probable F420-dependent enzyme